MLPWKGALAGRLDEQVITSELLKDNPLNDPFERPLIVYLPPGYDDEPDRRYPVVYIIMGYGGYVTMWVNRAAFRQPFYETADQVFASGAAPPAILVYVDAWTSYGGSQFGDCVRALREYDGDIWRWWEDFTSRTAFTKKVDRTLLGIFGVAACFSASELGKPELPFDPVTGVVRDEVWQRWLAWDPVRMVPDRADAVRSLHSIWIDAGNADDFYLDIGAAAFREALTKAGVSQDVIKYEIFDGTHAAIDYRYPLALAWLSMRMSV